MSKLVEFQIECPSCKQEYRAKVWRTLWGDGCTANDFNSRLTDETNVVTCPHCGHSFRLPLGLMYVDCKAGFAVWYEPQPDPGIDNDTRQYAAMFGADSYYAKAPRVKDWDEFKRTICRYYTGELKAHPISKFDFGAIKKQTPQPSKQSKNGCLGMALFIIIPLTLLFIL